MKYVLKFQKLQNCYANEKYFWPFENCMWMPHTNAKHVAQRSYELHVFGLFMYPFSRSFLFPSIARLKLINFNYIAFELAYFTSESYTLDFIGFLLKYFIKFIEFMAFFSLSLFRFSSSAVNLIWSWILWFRMHKTSSICSSYSIIAHQIYR